MGLLISLFWTSGDLLWVSKPGCTALFMLRGVIHVAGYSRFNSVVTPTDLLVASMAAELLQGLCIQWCIFSDLVITVRVLCLFHNNKSGYI